MSGSKRDETLATDVATSDAASVEFARLDPATRTELGAALLALDPWGLGGAVIRAPRHDIAERFVARVAALLPAGTPLRRLPLSIPDDRLLGGLDLAMTLALGRPVAERGLLATLDGGVLVVPAAERVGASLAARITQMMDTGTVPSRAPGASAVAAARVCVIALDESEADEEPVHSSIADRLAFRVELQSASHSFSELPHTDAPVTASNANPELELFSAADLEQARALYPRVRATDAQLSALVSSAEMFGVDSLRAVRAALRVARGCAALDNRALVNEQDVATAATLVLGPRATRIPAPPEDSAQPEEPPPPPPSDEQQDSRDDAEDSDVRELEERIIEAMQATLPVGLSIDAPSRAPKAGSETGRSGADRSGGLRGRQVGTRRGDPRGGGRLDIVETLRAAAPWQKLRARTPAADSSAPAQHAAHLHRESSGRTVRVQVRPDDFRIRKLFEPAGTTAIFVVDASGSSAVNRMAEAKGSVELLLAESYARRDEVALIAFRGAQAEILLPPTRAIAAAKRALAALPGGGGTPLASAIDRAVELTMRARREGNDTVVVFLTDARANVARDRSGGREAAMRDALQSAKVLRSLEGTTLLIDTSPRPSQQAQDVANEMGARYVALPRTDARSIHAAVSGSLSGAATQRAGRQPASR
jgi:magnesium chelatase subunit D